jgi:hypothetical protein
MDGPPERGASPGPTETALPAHRARFVLALLALAVVIVFLGSMLVATRGHFVPQVVDLYVVCQYARSFAEGHPFRYNPGEPPSTGATSLLHTVLLAGAHALGARGEGLVAVAVIAGAGFYMAAVLLARRVATRLGGGAEGLLAGGLLALGGPVVWGFLYGSDMALFMLLCLWLLERVLATWHGGPFGGAVAAGVLCALARPEGLPLVVALGAAWTLGPRSKARGAARALAWLPAAAAVLVLVLYRIVTGFWLGTSLADKSLFANYGITEGLALVSEYGVDVVRGLLYGFYPSQTPVGLSRGWAPYYFAPLALPLAVLALVSCHQPYRTPLRVWAGAVLLVVAATTANTFMGVHFNRYVMWAFPTVHILAAVGLGAFVRLLARGDAALQKSLFRAGAAVALLLGLLATTRFAVTYGGMAGDVYRRDVEAAAWIVRNLPPGVAMANMATSVEYLTGHRNLNLHGVTSPRFFGNRTAEREAGVWESLARLPEAERPTHLITTAATQESFPTMREIALLPPLYQTNSFLDEILIFRMHYDLVGKSARMFLPESLQAVSGLVEVDRLNVCDSADEAAHSYRFKSRLGNLPLHGTARIARYSVEGAPEEVVADGGRAILGHESFRIRTRKDADLVVVMRTSSSVNANVLRASGSGQYGVEIAEAGIVVDTGGQESARVTFRPRPGWDERSFRIPGRFLSEGTTTITLGGRYAAFFYWFYQ